MRKLAIFAGGYAAAVAAAALLFPSLDRVAVGAACVGAALLLVLLRRILPDKLRRRALLACIGAALGMLWTSGYDRLFLEPARQLDDTTLVLTGTVTDWPEATEYGVKVRVRAQLPTGGSSGALLYLDGQYDDLRPGDTVTTVAHCAFSDENGLGQQVSYHTSKGVFLIATAYGEAEITRPTQIPPAAIPAYAIRLLQQGIAVAIPGRTQQLALAVVTGNRSALEPLLTAGLKRVGMSHTVAVSGMHLAFFAGLLTLLMGRSRRLTALVSIPLIIFFVLMIGCPPSAVRAAVMLIMLQTAPLLGREGDTATSLLFALLLLLLHNPFAVADIGLQMSFGAVAGIALFARRLQARFTAKLTPAKGVRRLWYNFLRSVAGIVSVTLGAQVFTLPLSAYYFNTISLISPLANVLCAWSVSVLFIAGVVCGGLGILFPAVAGAVGMLAVPAGEYFHWVVTTLAEFPYAAIPARLELYLLWLGFIYILLALAFVLPGRKRLALPCTAAVVTVAVAIYCTVSVLQLPALQIDVLDVGQGQSVLLRCDDWFALVDCGGDNYHTPGDTAADLLHTHGCTELDLLVLTHCHDDHANGVPELLDRVAVKCIALPDMEPDSELRQQILAKAESVGAAIMFVREDCSRPFDGAELRLIAPLGKEGANEQGLTVLLTAGQNDVLITGDMDSDTERKLLAHTQLPDVEVLVVGHHGSKHSTCNELLEAVRPEFAVISVGAYNRFGHPTAQTLERLAAVGAEIYRTDMMGTVSLTVHQ